MADRHGLPFEPPEGSWFDAGAADAACAFFPRFLVHTESEWAGKPFELRDWQRDRIIRPAFGWKRKDGRRLIRTVYLEIAKKNGKSELAAGVAHLCLVADGEFGGQGYAAAVDENQAKIVFEKAKTMAALSEPLQKHLEMFKTSIYCPELMARFQPISAAPASKHGFSPSFSVKDEVHAWPTGELAQIIRDGMAARAQPIDWILTTAGVKGWGYGWEVHDRAVKILDGTLSDPTFLPVIFAAGADDDWTLPATWAKANPNLGISPRLDFIEEQCRQARESPRLENNFRRYHLNQWTEQVTRWLSLESWDACAGPVPWDRMEAAFEGRRCFAGLDLSAKIDLTAVGLVFPPPGPGGSWAVIPRLYMPADRIEERMKRDRLPYDHWIRIGAITATPGNVVDYGYIEEQLGRDARRFKIEECAFDAWNATQTALRLQDQGLTMVEFGQGYKSMSEPTKEFERLITAGLLLHGGHPVLREMAKAVSVASDPAGNLKPDKSHAALRIDGIVAAIMGLGRGLVQEKKPLSIAQQMAAGTFAI